MPKIPVYQSGVQEQGLPNVGVNQSAPVEAFGGGKVVEGPSRATERVLGIAQDLAIKEKQRADDTVSMMNYDSLIKKKNELLYHPESGAMNRTGLAALDSAREYGDQFDKYSKSLEANVANEDQREMFTKMRLKIGSELNESLQRHAFGESEKLRTQVTASALESTKNDAILNYQDPDKVEQSIVMQRNLIETEFEGKLPGDIVEQKASQAASATYRGVLERLMATGQSGIAKKYFADVKERLTGEDAEAVEKSMKVSILRGDSQQALDDIVRKHGSMSGAIEAARKINDPDTREATLSLVRQYFSDRHQAEEDADRQRYNAASDILEKSKDLSQIPPQIWSNMSGDQHRKLEERLRQLRAGIEPEPNGDEYYNLMQMAAAPAMRDKFMRTNLTEYRHKVTNSELSKLIDIQTAGRKGDSRAEKLLDGYRTNAEIVDSTLREMGIKPNAKPGTEAAKRVNDFRRIVDQQVTETQARTGKKISNEEMQSIVDNLARKGAVEGSGVFGLFRSHKYAFEAENNEKLEVEVKDIPQVERTKIEAALKARRIPVTDLAVQKLYQQKLYKMVNRGG